MQTSDAMYFVDAGRHVSYEMRDVATDASGLLMTALTQHGLFIVTSIVIGFISTAVILFIRRRMNTLPSIFPQAVLAG